MPSGAFRSPDFRRFMVGAAISSIGSWMQIVAVPYVLFSMTDSGVYVGLAGVARFLPAVPLAPLAGALADRCDRRVVLQAAQVIQASAAAVLWLTWAAGVRSPVLILLLVAVGGTTQSVSSAALQAFVADLVPPDDLLQALTVNSAQANLARALGPALGGVILALLSPSWAFMLNALSFAPLMVVLAGLEGGGRPSVPDAGGIVATFVGAVRNGLRRTGFATAMVLIVMLGACAYPVYQLTVVVAREVYDVGPALYGVLAASFGIGAVGGAVLLTAVARRHARTTLVVPSIAVLGAALVVYGSTESYVVGLFTLAAIGATGLITTAVLNTAVQTQAAPEARGTLLAAWIVAYNVAFSIGAIAMGYFAERVGPRLTIVTSGLIVGAVVLVLTLRPGYVRSLAASA